VGKIFTTMSVVHIATQIAEMINSYNKLYKVYSTNDILTGTIDYFVEIVGDKVVGCIGLERRTLRVYTIRHLSVLQNYRGKGLGKKLIGVALENCNTDVEMMIREGNLASIRAALSMNFNAVSVFTNIDHRVIKFLRRR